MDKAESRSQVLACVTHKLSYCKSVYFTQVVDQCTSSPKLQSVYLQDKQIYNVTGSSHKSSSNAV